MPKPPIQLLFVDCLEVMKSIPAGSVDLVLTDPPYGTTACKWDSVIPLEPMWEQLKRLTKPDAAIVMTASQPFTAALIYSNPKEFKYCWTWDKRMITGFLNAKKQPLRVVEDVCVFYRAQCVYNPVMTKGEYRNKGGYGKPKGTDVYGDYHSVPNSNDDYYPTQLLSISNASQRGKLHPTQKPVPLMEYLIKTYTNEGDTVLDFTMGSGTTGVAAKRLARRFVGIENDPKYFEMSTDRINSTEWKSGDVD